MRDLVFWLALSQTHQKKRVERLCLRAAGEACAAHSIGEDPLFLVSLTTVDLGRSTVNFHLGFPICNCQWLTSSQHFCQGISGSG